MQESQRAALLGRIVVALYQAAAGIEAEARSYWLTRDEEERIGKLVVACRIEAGRFASIREMIAQAKRTP